jgi:hypothetical protein
VISSSHQSQARWKNPTPLPPPTKGGFKGKRIRSRSLSRVPKKHPNNQKKRKAQQPLPPSMILLILQPPTQLSPTNLLFLWNSSILPRRNMLICWHLAS